MPTVKLTKRAIDAIPPTGKRAIWFDSDLKGFGLKIEPTGVKTWIVEYRPVGGGRAAAKRRLTVGKLGALAPEQARGLAKDILARVHSGEDPALDRAEAKTAKTVAELCDLYLAEAEAGHVVSRRGAPKKASTLTTDRAGSNATSSRCSARSSLRTSPEATWSAFYETWRTARRLPT